MTDYEAYPENDEYYEEPARPNRTWLIVAIVVVVLLCCCCLVLAAGLALFSQDILNALENMGAATLPPSSMIALP
jgi:hypothetical protein